MKWWPTFLLASVIFFMLSYYTPRKEKKFEMLDDGCLVQSIYFQQSVQAKEMLEGFMWTRVLCIQFYGRLGHAVTIFIYKNVTWIYDPNRGSFPIATYPLYDPFTAAEIAFPNLLIKKAYYIEPTFLLHYRNDRFNMN